MRSYWKGNFIDVKKNNVINKSSVVLNVFLRKKFNIHNGKNLEQFTIKREMIGFKIGEFVFTRKMGVSHKKKNKKNKTNKNKK